MRWTSPRRRRLPHRQTLVWSFAYAQVGTTMTSLCSLSAQAPSARPCLLQMSTQEKKVIKIRLDDSWRENMEGTVIKTQEDPAVRDLEQRVMKAAIDESEADQVMQDASMKEMQELGPTPCPPRTRSTSRASSSGSSSSGRSSTTPPRRRGRSPRKRSHRRPQSPSGSPPVDSRRQRSRARHAPSRAPSRPAEEPQRLATRRTQTMKRYTVDIAEVMDNVLLDYDRLVQGFPHDQVRIKIPILYVHSQKWRVTMLRQLDSLLDKQLRIFEKNNNFYIPAPLALPKQAAKKAPKAKAKGKAKAKAQTTSSSSAALPRAHLKPATHEPMRYWSGATGSEDRPKPFAPWVRQPRPPTFPPSAKRMRAAQPPPMQRGPRPPRAAPARTYSEDLAEEAASGNDDTVSPSHLTLQHVKEVSTMLRSIAQVLTPRAMTRPTPSSSACPIAQRLRK